MTGDVYQHATSVVVCLGEDQNEVVRAMKLMSWLNTQVQMSDNFASIEAATQSSTSGSVHTTIADRSLPLPFDGADLLVLYHLFLRPWFNRLWIRQEISLAKPSAAVAVCPTPFRGPSFEPNLYRAGHHVLGLAFRGWTSTMPLLREAYGDIIAKTPAIVSMQS
ncbi:hypothetical protein GGR57DRAFT_71016 [Xylariaceae sp. FL1272]|nr:hypothetical protein GGR57DRAFT_71016 [Xylariaceae sp. FL1272]